VVVVVVVVKRGVCESIVQRKIKTQKSDCRLQTWKFYFS